MSPFVAHSRHRPVRCTRSLLGASGDSLLRCTCRLL